MDSIIVRYRKIDAYLQKRQRQEAENIITALLDGLADSADYHELEEMVKYGEACTALNSLNAIEFEKLVPFFRSLNTKIYGN